MLLDIDKVCLPTSFITGMIFFLAIIIGVAVWVVLKDRDGGMLSIVPFTVISTLDEIFFISITIIGFMMLLLSATFTVSNRKSKKRDIALGYELVVLNENLNEMAVDITDIKNVVNNGTEEKLNTILNTIPLNAAISADAGIIKYFHSKLSDVIKQYNMVKTDILKGKPILEKIQNENFTNIFLGGGASELRTYYSYKIKDEIFYYPDQFLNCIDKLNKDSYNRFIERFRDYKIEHKDDLHALQGAIKEAFEHNIRNIFTTYTTYKPLIKDPQLMFMATNIDVLNDNSKVCVWKSMISQGDYNIGLVIKSLLKINLKDNVFNTVVSLSARWHNIIDDEIIGIDHDEEKNDIVKSLLLILDKIKEDE